MGRVRHTLSTLAVAGGLILFLVLFGGLFGASSRESWSLLSRGTETPGEIVEYTSEAGEDVPHATFRFTDATGYRRTVRSPMGASFGQLGRGSVVSVRYDPDDPRRADLTRNLLVWGVGSGLVALVTLGLAAFIALAALASMLVGPPQPDEPPVAPADG